MSGSELEKTMAPKRRRMMDMVMVLGGLKEESAIPLSKVNEEMNLFSKEISSLTDEILAFPDSYFSEFLQVAEKTGLIDDVNEKGVLADAISQIEEALSISQSEGLAGLIDLLKERQKKFQRKKGSTTTDSGLDIAKTLNDIPALLTEIESKVEEFEKEAEEHASKTKDEVRTLASSVNNLLANNETSPDETLAALQKLGTKTRYGSFLRTTAQIKRGKREGRIDEERFLQLLRGNIVVELRRGIILYTLNNVGSMTVVQLGELMGTPASEIQYAIVTMIQRGEVEMVGLDGDAPVFARVLSKSPDTTLIIKRLTQQVRGLIRSAEGKTQEQLEESVGRLEGLQSKLQIIGEYDESILAESVEKLRELVDSATEAALSSDTSDDAEELKLLISAGLEAFARFRLKITLEKGPNLVSGTNVYGEKLDPEFYEKIMDSYLENELERGTILLLIRDTGPMSAHDLAEMTDIPQDRIFQHLLRMKGDELLTLAGESHGYVLYDVPRTLNAAELTIQTVSDMALRLTNAREELEGLLSEIKAEDIGKIAAALETFSKAHDKLVKITVSGSVVAKSLIESVEEKIKSAVLLAYRTRAKIPSTRPKVTIEDLLDVDVPSVLDEYRSQMGYAPLLGFGNIHWEQAKCVGCKSCEIACPEDAILLVPTIEVPKYFDIPDEELEAMPVNKSLFYRTVRGLAVNKPAADIHMDKETPGFGTVKVDLWLCVACRTCVRRCPGHDDGALELELKWNLPEVVKQIKEHS